MGANTKIKVGDKIVSDDHCAIGILTEKEGKLFVIGDFGEIEYDDYSADWTLFSVWLEKNFLG